MAGFFLTSKMTPMLNLPKVFITSCGVIELEASFQTEITSSVIWLKREGM
jgi:hypothetical protein